MHSNEFWLNNPAILFKKNKITQIWPNDTMNYSNKLNAISRFVVLLSALGYMCLQKTTILLIGLITLGIICVLSYYNNNTTLVSQIEGFEDIKKTITPNETNPLMNVSLNDYTDNPNKPPSALISEPNIPEQINNVENLEIDNVALRNNQPRWGLILSYYE